MRAVLVILRTTVLVKCVIVLTSEASKLKLGPFHGVLYIKQNDTSLEALSEKLTEIDNLVFSLATIWQLLNQHAGHVNHYYFTTMVHHTKAPTEHY